jgi:hypothetical protein
VFELRALAVQQCLRVKRTYATNERDTLNSP